MRCFIAVKPSLDICKKAYDLGKQFENIMHSIAVKPENMHITLFFLGEQNDTDVDIISEMIEKLDFNSFYLTFNRLDFFGNIKYPKVLFVKGHSNALKQIHKDLSDMLGQKEISFDKKPFNIHLTLRRIKKLYDKEAFLKILKEINNNFKTMQTLVNSVELIKSELNPGGAVYKTIFSKRA
jgi:2'-5' RNA ligase